MVVPIPRSWICAAEMFPGLRFSPATSMNPTAAFAMALTGRTADAAAAPAAKRPARTAKRGPKA